MMGRNLLWASLLAVPLVAGGLVYANPQALSYLGITCGKCCSFNESEQPAPESSDVCPSTGEQASCEKCCPVDETK